MDEKKKNKKVIVIILAIILVLAIGSGGWYLGVQYANKTNSQEKENSKNEEKKDDTVREKDEEKEINADQSEEKSSIVEANEKLDTFSFVLYLREIASNGDELYSLIKNNEFLTLNNKMNLAWNYAIYNAGRDSSSDSKVKIDVNSKGEEVTGVAAVLESYYKDYYKKMFGEELTSSDYSVLGHEGILKDGYIYANFPTGGTGVYNTLKFNSLTENGNQYILIIDCIRIKDIVEAHENEELKKYLEYETTEYPKDIVSYQIKMILEKNDDIYIIKNVSLVN